METMSLQKLAGLQCATCKRWYFDARTFSESPYSQTPDDWDSPIALLELAWYASVIGLWVWWQLRR